jgi:hypothetical protein
MDPPILVLRTGLESPHETLKHYVLDISFLYHFRDVRMSEIPSRNNVFPALKTFSLRDISVLLCRQCIIVLHLFPFSKDT